MIIKIDTASETPIYRQLRNEIVTGIGRGELKIGESLPTVRQMAADLGVNTMTVNKAYQLLKSEGYLLIDRRNGAFVAPPQEADTAFYEAVSDRLSLISAEAMLRGVKKKEFLKLCEARYAEMQPAEG